MICLVERVVITLILGAKKKLCADHRLKCEIKNQTGHKTKKIEAGIKSQSDWPILL